MDEKSGVKPAAPTSGDAEAEEAGSSGAVARFVRAAGLSH